MKRCTTSSAGACPAVESWCRRSSRTIISVSSDTLQSDLMNRAERRRQEKTARKQPTGEDTQRLTIQALKTRLRQAASPEEVRRIITALVTQGLPAATGEELAA